jgi:tetratricopeptide (TPR) repeat protein
MKHPPRSHIFTLVFCLILVLLTFSTCTVAQTPSELANAAYESKDWAKATELYTQIASLNPKDGRAWYRLGVSLHHTGQEEEAIAAFEQATANAAPVHLVQYQTALAYASLKNSEQTFSFLEKAVSNGFAQPELLRSDLELQPYRSDPRFLKVAEQAMHNEKPCTYAPENRQFDFWIGEWNVVTTAGNMTAGKSHIEKILNDCVIFENWSSATPPYQGKSFNTYNTSLKRWEQFWADNSQGMIYFYGSLKDGIMDFWTDAIPQSDGKLLKGHLQFIPLGPDKVRQFSQGSNDEGKTWFVEYDFTYNRVK